ncbi:MAG TPA: ABC transporter permease [Chloroflexota bacterium]|nr:ABC transporter permease [Chloroflexota bacterium]
MFTVSFPSALEALKANKGRSILTTLGIIIGVGSVIAMVSIGEGAKSQVADRLASLGTNVLTVQPGSTRSGGVSGGAGTVQTLTDADAVAIGQEVDDVAALSPIVQGQAQLVVGSQNWSTRIQGVWPEYQDIQTWKVARGAFFSKQDNDEARSVAVIGQTVADNLYPGGQDPIGTQLRIRNVPFVVVGVLAPKGSSGFQDQDDVVMIPFETGQVRLFGPEKINQISVQATDGESMTTVQNDITALLRSRHRLRPTDRDDFQVRNSNQIVETASGVAQTLTMLLAGVAAVSLVVGGIGIMNIMLVSVTERTREIGIRMAIGARPGNVLSQFLVEAILLSVMGGLIGIALGLGIAFSLPKIAGWASVVTGGSIALAFGFSALIGVFFGYYPARKASQLNPIDALRYD